MSKKQGYILLYRSIQDHWLYPKGRKFSAYEAWNDLLFKAAHTQHKQLDNGKLVTMQVGEFITSLRQLSEEWRWSREKVTSFIETLMKDEMLVMVAKTSRSTTFKITNYEHFQGKSMKSSTTHSTSHSATGSTTQRTEESPDSLSDSGSTPPIKKGNKFKQGKLAPSDSVPESTDMDKGSTWRIGVDFLIRKGNSESASRSFLAKLFKSHSQNQIVDALNKAMLADAAEPKAYIVAVLKKQGKPAVEDEWANHQDWLNPYECAQQGCKGCLKKISSK